MSVFRMPKYGLPAPKTHIWSYEKRVYLGPLKFDLTYPIVFIPKEDD